MAVGLSISDLTAILRCPSGDGGELELIGNELICQTCSKKFLIRNEIAILLEDKDDH